MAEDAPAIGHEASLRLLDGFSIEMTGRDASELEAAAHLLPVGTRVSVTCLGSESIPLRISAATTARRLGFVPVPHVGARRLRSPYELEQFLSALATEAAAKDALVIGGDPATPLGPYADALAVIRTGLLDKYGFQHVSIAGYPEGHPQIGTDRLWKALTDKVNTLDALGHGCTVVTQFGFTVEPVLSWLVELRRRGIEVPVRIGVPGPAGTKRLLGLARRLGVASSKGIVHKYGRSLTDLLGHTGPDGLVTGLADRYDPGAHGPVLLHLYTFGGITATARWVQQLRDGVE